MGLFRRALSSQLSKYKKRKTISLDGSVAGMAPGFAGPRHYAQAQDGWFGTRSAAGEHSIYDAHAHYQQSSQDYEQPPEWFVGAPKRGTPPLRLDPVARGPFPPHPKYLMMTDELMAEAMEHLPDAEEFDEREVLDDLNYPVDLDERDAAQVYSSEALPMPDDDELVTQVLGEHVLAPMEAHPWYTEQAMTQEQFADAMAGVAGPDLEAHPVSDDGAPTDGYAKPQYGEPWPSDYGVPLDEYGSELAAYADEQMRDGSGEGHPCSMGSGQAEGLGTAFGDDEMMQEAYGDEFGLDAIAQGAGPMDMMADEFEQSTGGLEATVQEMMPEPEELMEDMMEPEPEEQPLPEDEMMPDPWQMPGGFGPGFGPMGPMPGP